MKSTVTGDVRNRLGTLSQQILSATRLQKIIDNLNLYPAEKKIMAREDLIAMMTEPGELPTGDGTGSGTATRTSDAGASGGPRGSSPLLALTRWDVEASKGRAQALLVEAPEPAVDRHGLDVNHVHGATPR